MVDFERAREFMVDNQLRPSNITDWRILAQMSVVPRENFVPSARRDLAYIDDVQWFGTPGTGRFMSAPATLARLIQLGDIDEADAVLVVGAGTGYSTAVIAGLAGSVVGLESDGALAEAARGTLADLGIGNATISTGEIAEIGDARFDVVIVEGALEVVPESFFKVLKDGGRLVALIRSGAVAVATVFLKTGDGVASRPEFNASLPPLFTAKPEEQFVF
jgi:protein-L-isoaspartate(D-aspartate) O-methyltransferase